MELDIKQTSLDDESEEFSDEKLIIGTLHVIKYDDCVDNIIFDPKPQELVYLKMRGTMNSHRNYRFFYFKANKEVFEMLEILCKKDEKKLISFIKESEVIKIEPIANLTV